MATVLRVLALGAVLTAASDSQDASERPCVAYLFLQGLQQMELEEVWKEYFQSCPPNSYTVHAHVQSVTPFPLMEAQIVPFPIMGELRYKWEMQEAMHKLYQSALNSTAGCKPHWLQLVSPDTAPIQSCFVVHAALARNPGVSLIEAVKCPGADLPWSMHSPPPSMSPFLPPPPPPPPPPIGIEAAVGEPSPEFQEGKGCWENNRPHGHTGAWYKASQWVTLWSDHARHLLGTDKAPPDWKATLPAGLGFGAPDEFFTANVSLMCFKPNGNAQPYRDRKASRPKPHRCFCLAGSLRSESALQNKRPHARRRLHDHGACHLSRVQSLAHQLGNRLGSAPGGQCHRKPEGMPRTDRLQMQGPGRVPTWDDDSAHDWVPETRA